MVASDNPAQRPEGVPFWLIECARSFPEICQYEMVVVDELSELVKVERLHPITGEVLVDL
jgi:hypothetical protein